MFLALATLAIGSAFLFMLAACGMIGDGADVNNGAYATEVYYWRKAVGVPYSHQNATVAPNYLG